MRRQLGPGAGEQLDVADDLDARLAGALGDRVAVERQAGGDDEGVELGEVGGVEVGDTSSPEGGGQRIVPTPRPPSSRQPPLAGFLRIPRRHLRAARKQRLDRREAGPRQAVHRIMLAGEGAGGDHRSFSVASPASASTKLTIQKRITTVGSDQPRCSKWWWIGAIRNTRFPVRL